MRAILACNTWPVKALNISSGCGIATLDSRQENGSTTNLSRHF